MSVNKIFILFGVIFLIFAGIVFYQFNAKSIGTVMHPVTGPSVTIDNATFMVEVAKTPKELQQGLSDRSSLAADRGMLFLLDKPGYATFWMRGMKIPLDMIFIENNKVSAVFEELPPVTTTDDLNIPKYGHTADKVLEINAGMAHKNNIKAGDPVIVKL